MNNYFGRKDSVTPKAKQLFESAITSDKQSSHHNVIYNSAILLSDELKSKPLKRKYLDQSTSQATSLNNDSPNSDTPSTSGYTQVDSNASEDSDSASLKPTRLKKKKNVQAQILDLLKEDKKETQENNKQFFNLMGRLIELEEEKLKILKSKTT